MQLTLLATNKLVGIFRILFKIFVIATYHKVLGNDPTSSIAPRTWRMKKPWQKLMLHLLPATKNTFVKLTFFL